MSTSNMESLISANADRGLLNIEQAAEYLGRSVRTIYNWICSQNGPRRIKRFGRWYFNKSDLDAYVKHNTEVFEAFQ